jgi:hypothetical protein
MPKDMVLYNSPLKASRFDPYGPISLVPYVPIIYDADGNAIRGTIFPDQYVNAVRYAVSDNNEYVERLSKSVQINRDVEIRIPIQTMNNEIIRPYLRSFRFLLQHSITGVDVSWSIVCTYFLQIGQLYWLVNRMKLLNYDQNLYFNDIASNSALSSIPRKHITSLTQMETLDALSDLAFLVKHVPHTLQLTRLYDMMLLHALKYLMGPGKLTSRMFDGHLDNNRMALLTYLPKHGDCYVASGRYVLHLAIRFFYLMRTINLMHIKRRDFTSDEFEFILQYNLPDKIRQLVLKKLDDNKEFIEQKKSELIYGGRISQGDREISKIEFPGQDLPTDIIRNLHPRQSDQILSKIGDFTTASLITLVSGVAGLDIAEYIVLSMFFSHVSANDSRIPLQPIFVIDNDVVDNYRQMGKLLDSNEPFIVQLDARYHLQWNRVMINTRDIYETLSGWLAIVYLHFKGIPEQYTEISNVQHIGCLYNTYRQFCGASIALPTPVLQLK